MLQELLNGFVSGAGFIAGVLVVYTIYDAIFVAVARRREKAEAAKRRKRRR